MVFSALRTNILFSMGVAMNDIWRGLVFGVAWGLVVWAVIGLLIWGAW